MPETSTLFFNKDDGDSALKRTRWIWWCIPAAVLVVSATAGFQALGSETEDSNPNKVNCEPLDDQDVSPPPSGSGVKVLESNLVNLDPKEAFGTWSFGLIAENDSALIAKDVTFTLTAAFDNGEAMTGDQQDPWVTALKFPLVYPGQQLGAGQLGDWDLNSGTTSPDTTAELDIEIEVAGWFTTDHVQSSGLKLGPNMSFGRPSDPDAFIGFSITSGFCHPMPVSLGQVFRSADGDIVGGTIDQVSSLDGHFCSGPSVESAEPGNNDMLCVPNAWQIRFVAPEKFDVQPDMSQTSVYPLIGELPGGS